MQDLTDEKKNQKTGAQKSVAKWNSRTDKKKKHSYMGIRSMAVLFSSATSQRTAAAAVVRMRIGA